ncbi:MAG: dual specificity protein phosphatase family protein [Alphaproteobacteria bacterium]|nr:dual specificity protein phosphatase family protein [Alphaproteobacteria bacterium]OJV13185.1 MAG: hypothetical protein BGO27_00070 [Alphaproteobacteria bacterium 33-17]
MLYTTLSQAADSVDDYIYEYDLSEFDAPQPRHYRQIVPSTFFKSDTDRISASGMFTELQLMFLKENALKIGRRLLLIDIMNETHYFINGKPVRVTPKKHLQTVTIKPSDLIGRTLKIYVKDDKLSTMVTVETAEYEADLAKRLDIDYIRIPIRNMFTPNEEKVKIFEEALEAFANSHLIHIHCKAGRGRTTTMLGVYSIYRYSKKHSLEEILKFQKDLGGIDLSTKKAENKQHIFKILALDRAKFIEDYYIKNFGENTNGNNN